MDRPFFCIYTANYIVQTKQNLLAKRELSNIALGQRMIADAPITIFYTSVMYRITERYGDRGIRYAYFIRKDNFVGTIYISR